MTALALRRAYLDGTKSPVAEVETCLERCAEDNLNTFITIDHQGAITAAKASLERYRAGRSLGLWDGVPFASKDNIAAANLPWTAGIGAYRERVAEQDADIIAFMKAEGAVLIGKTNLHEAALGTTNDNPWFGACHNPHRRGYIPGGSSGGSGAAVGAGLVPLALGTDTMGSVRVPASYCGGYGYKPGPGVISQVGMTPLTLAFDTIGLIAASSADLECYSRSLGGLEPSATPTADNPLTIGILDEAALSACAPDVLSQYEQAVARLRDAGFKLEFAPWFDNTSAIRRAGLAICITDGYLAHAEALAENPDGFSEELRRFLTFGRDFPAQKLQGSKTLIKRLQHDQPHLWAAFDLVLTPVTPYPAHSFEERAPDDLADFTAPANLIGLPASSLPFGRSVEDVPLGIQLIGKKGEDEKLLAQTTLIDGILNPDRQASP